MIKLYYFSSFDNHRNLLRHGKLVLRLSVQWETDRFFLHFWDAMIKQSFEKCSFWKKNAEVFPQLSGNGLNDKVNKKKERLLLLFFHSVWGHSDVTLPKCCYFIFKHFNKFEAIPSTCLRKWMNVWITPICQPGGVNSVSAGIGTSTATLWLLAKYGSCKTVQSFQTKVKVTKHIVCEWWN